MFGFHLTATFCTHHRQPLEMGVKRKVLYMAVIWHFETLGREPILLPFK